ncbi:hypothetical protein [Marinobacterium arenosum]|uniref:hypothetical protein n=1 Tax=Marinobacterium arenosum TaxID=2862496 RepID=UPI001C96732A|nr:hypothetical protein [Marinobacterium arenosum]MBY4676528.1 hypothetical protein [Marinobacterium arenosum]
MKLILVLSNHQLDVVVIDKGTVLRAQTLDYPLADGELAQLFDGLPADTATYLVLNLIEEERFEQRVAKVMPWEQDKLFERVLRRRLGNNSQVYSRWSGRATNAEGKRELIAQVVSIADSGELAPLLDHLTALGINLKGVYSQAELLAAFRYGRGKAPRKKAGDAEILLACSGPGHYQQLLILDGYVRLSRQVLLASDDLEALQAEQRSFERFIMVQRLVPYGQQFSYQLIAADEDAALRLRPFLSNDREAAAASRFTAADGLLKGEQELSQHNPALALIVDGLARHAPKTHFKPACLAQNVKKRGAVALLWTLTGLLTLAGLLQLASLATHAYSRWTLTGEMARAEHQYLAQARRYEAQINLPARAEDIQDSTEFVDKLLAMKQQPGMREAFVEIGRVLARYPALTLLELRWKLAEFGDPSRQKVRLTLQLKPADQKLSELSSMVDRFLVELKQSPMVHEIERGKLPIDRSATDSIKFDSKELVKEAYEFDVRIKMGGGYAKAG